MSTATAKPTAMATAPAPLRAALAVALLLVTACTQEHTLAFVLAFPPGTTRLPEDARRVRLTLDRPLTVAEGEVAADGSFSVALEIPSEGGYGRVTLEALDAGAKVVARGRSATVPLGAIDGVLVLYVAPPGRFSESPLALDPPRGELAATALPYGALFAGGRDAAGARRAENVIYNVNFHAWELGEPLPEPRARLAAATASFEQVVLLGGLATSDAPVAAGWVFSTRTPPDGLYTALPADAAHARANGELAALGGDRFLWSGGPPVLVDVGAGSVTAFAGAPAEAAAAETATRGGTSTAWIALAGGGGVVVYDVAADAFTEPQGPGRVEHGAAVDTEGRVVLLGGRDPYAMTAPTSAVRVDAAGSTFEVPWVLSRPRLRPAVARAGDLIVVAGGFDALGTGLDDADVLDAATLERVATVPLLAPRGGAIAVSLPNDSVLLAGGKVGENGAPVGTLELFTP